MKAPFFIPVLAILAILLVLPVLAQVPPDMPPAPNQAPVEGLALLAMAGAGYAAYRLRKHRDPS